MKRIHTLTKEARELLEPAVLQYIHDTFCCNPKLGKAFVDNEDNPKSCILLLNHWLFFGGNVSEECLAFISNEILTGDVQNRLHILYIIYPNNEWKNALVTLFPDKSKLYQQSLYRSTPKCTGNLPGYNNIVEITPELMSSNTANLDMIKNEVLSTATYDDMEDFFSRGFGFAPVIDNKVCGFCTSEYPSENAIAIGIEVLKEYQKQGYARAMTQAFLNKAAQRNLDVYWQCWKDNTASVKTALSSGFEKVADYPMLFVKL
ncbi:MAG: GNAT family N-acetyltransferase [Bacillota bacterium]|jgi:GNAT superfamily N-acetyltransferase